MGKTPLTFEEAIAENEELRARLEEAEEGIRAIRSGEIDAVVVTGPKGEQIYTLSGAERTYRILVEAMNEGALVLSLEGVIIYCNRTFAAMLSASIYDVLGHSMYEFVVSADVEHLRQMLEHAPLRTGRREIELKHRDSCSVPASVSVGNLETEDGPSVSAVVTDLTEHKRTEAELEKYRQHLEELVVERTRELRESEERAWRQLNEIEAIYKSAHIGLCIFDRQLRFVRINDRLAEINGIPAADHIGNTVREVMPSFADASEELAGRIFETGQPVLDLELMGTTSSQPGVERHWIEHWIPLFDEEGSTVGINVVVEEVTERKKAEEELRETREESERRTAQLESFIASMADGVTLFDANGRAIMMNDAGRAIFGVPSDENFDDWLQYQRFTLGGEPIPIEDAASFRALRGETVRNMRYKAISPWGREFIMSVSASPVLDSEGRVIGATNVFRDISDQVEFERQRQDLFEREHRIAEMLQEALIPSQAPYDLHGISIATRYQAALKEAQVGGDFYDVFELDEGKIGILIGDVAGKGLQAAIRVAAVRHSVRSYAYLEPSPAKVMTLTNEALIRENADENNLMTAFFAVLDASKRTLTYVSAGHEPPVVCKPGNDTEELGVTGAMLGIIPGAKYFDQVYTLHAGDNVVMFTDGITEARRNGSDLFDKVGVIEHLARCCDAPPDDIAEALLEAATAYAGGTLQDDAAIVVLTCSKDW